MLGKMALDTPKSSCTFMICNTEEREMLCLGHLCRWQKKAMVAVKSIRQFWSGGGAANSLQKTYVRLTIKSPPLVFPDISDNCLCVKALLHLTAAL